jgi:DNA-binding SARP family transcriptional activator
MEFRILGPLEVVDRGRRVRLAGPRERALLALFLLRANEVVAVDRLLEELWSEQLPASGTAAVQMQV